MSAYQTARFHTGEGWRCALVREGRTKLHVIVLEDRGVHHLAVDRAAVRTLQPLLYRGYPYPVRRMARKLREIGHRRGITEAARTELTAAGLT